MEGAGPPEPTAEQGWVAQGVAEEFPGLAISWIVSEHRPKKSPPVVRERLGDLSNRFYGAHAVQLREKPIPWAYRVFFRQIGLDPDETRTPVEELALARMRQGGFRSSNPTNDAMTIATVETGIAIRAFDDSGFRGPLGIRLSAPGEALDGQSTQLPPETLVVADEERPLEVLFGPTGEAQRVTKATREVAFAAIQVKGVPAIAVEEAFWTLSAVLGVV